MTEIRWVFDSWCSWDHDFTMAFIGLKVSMTFHGLEYDPVPVILSNKCPGRHALSEWVETSCVRAWEIRPNHLNQLETRVCNKKNCPTLCEFPQHMRNPETETMDWRVLCVLPCWIEVWSTSSVSGLTLMALPPRVSPFVSGPDHWKLSCHVLSSLGCLGLLEVTITLGFQRRLMFLSL